MGFTVTHASYDGMARLRLTGELDMGSAPEFSAAVDRLLDDGAHRLLVELDRLIFLDSVGMAAFVRADSRTAATGGWLRLTGATGQVARVLRISGLDELLGYEQPEDPPSRFAR